MSVVEFTGGKRCAECDEQIAPKRIQACPGARLCTECQQDRDMTLSKAYSYATSNGRETVKAKRSRIIIEW